MGKIINRLALRYRDWKSDSPLALLLFFALLMLPILGAIWFLPNFFTQDGPLHLYNARILVELVKSDSYFQVFYALRVFPLPYWGGYLLLGGLTLMLPGRTADQLIMSMTSVGFASAVLWLRWQVKGWKGMAQAIPFIALLPINMIWLMGLYGFLLGACLYLITLGIWWKGRENIRLGRALLISGLLVVGFLFHLISTGLAVVALVILALTTPGSHKARRFAWTAASMLALLPLVVAYYRLMRTAGEVRPAWIGLSEPNTLKNWLHYLQVPNIFSIDLKSGAFLAGEISWVPAPAILLAAGLLVLIAVKAFDRLSRAEASNAITRGWVIVASMFILAAFVGPEQFGDVHGGILRERVLLVGLASLAPFLDFDFKRFITKMVWAIILAATVLQIYLLWNYASSANEIAGEFVRARSYIGNRQRVGALMIDARGRYIASPLPNLCNIFGVGSENMIWNNYGPNSYYFPIKFENQLSRDLSELFFRMQFNYLGNRETAGEGLAMWFNLLKQYHTEIDVLIIWNSTPEVDAINSVWFRHEPAFSQGRMRVLKHR